MLLVTIEDSSQVHGARSEAAGLARYVGLPEAQEAKLALVITEAATNLLKHAGSGCIILSVAENDPECGIDVLAVDKGPGMADSTRCLQDGYSTAGSSGTGLGAIKRLSDAFDLYSMPGTGTILFARIGPLERPLHRPRPWLVGGVCLPIKSEKVSGDDWGRREDEDGLTVLMADGLGHGLLAADASKSAITAVDGNSSDPVTIINRAHAASRATRGSAVAVARFDRTARCIRYAGIGNIAGRQSKADGTYRSFVSLPGIVGHEMRKVQPFDYELPEGAVTVMHSDGLGTSWDFQAYPGLHRAHPAVIAGLLWRDFARGRDDVTVVAVREGW